MANSIHKIQIKQVMLAFLRGFMFRMAIRPAVVLTTVGSATSYGSGFHDLRGELPTTGTYKHRSIETVEGVIWHHSATNGATIRSIAEFHTEVRKWPGIAYHYAIGHDGTVYILNDVESVSYHSKDNNLHNIGVVLIGNYQDRPIPDHMRNAIYSMNDYLKEEYDLRYCWMHIETKKTLCPGKNAIEVLKPITYGPRPER